MDFFSNEHRNKSNADCCLGSETNEPFLLLSQNLKSLIYIQVVQPSFLIMITLRSVKPWPVTLSDGTCQKVVNRLDCIGDICPKPQLKLKKTIKSLASGEVIEVVINNLPSLETLPALCLELGATHLDTYKEPNIWKLFIRKE